MMSTLKSLQERLQKLNQAKNVREKEEESIPAVQKVEPMEEQSNTAEITDHTQWMQQIEEKGNYPEDWLQIVTFTENSKFTNTTFRFTFLLNLYARAFQCIPTDKARNNIAFAQLLVNCANLKSVYNPEDARVTFGNARCSAKKFAFVHIAAAQFELDQGNSEKARKFLEKAIDLKAQPVELIKIAFSNLLRGIKQLLSEEEKQKVTSVLENKENAFISPSDQPKLGKLYGTVDPLSRKLQSENRNHEPQPERERQALSKPLLPIEGSSVKPKVEAKHSYTDVFRERHFTGEDSGTIQTKGVAFSKPTTSTARKEVFVPVTPTKPHPAGEITLSTCYVREHVDTTVSFKLSKDRGDRESTICGSLSDEADTVPIMPVETTDGGKRVMRTFHSTPDCKQAGLLSTEHITHRKITGKARRVLRSTLPQVTEGMQNSDDDDGDLFFNIKPLPEEVEVEPNRFRGVTVNSYDNDSDSGVHTEGGSCLRGISQKPSQSTTSSLLNPPSSTNCTCNSRLTCSLHPKTKSDSRSSLPNTFGTKDYSMNYQATPMQSNSSRHRSGPVSDMMDISSTLSSQFNTQISSTLVGNHLVHASVCETPSTQRQQTITGMSSCQKPMHAMNCAPPMLQTPQPANRCMMPGGNLATPMMPPGGGMAAMDQMGQSLQQNMGMPIPMSTPMGKQNQILFINGQAYTMLKMIGKGGFSKIYCHTHVVEMLCIKQFYIYIERVHRMNPQVYDVFDSENNLWAVKCVNFDSADDMTVNSYKNEIKLLKHLQYSDKIIKLRDFEYNQQCNMLYVVMDRGDTDLASLFKGRSRITASTRRYYWEEMLEAVQVLHQEGIIHSDLKPANFLLVAGRLKLIDFGISHAIQPDVTSVTLDQQVGTISYMSPEAIMDTCRGSQKDEQGRVKVKIKIGVKSDVWSLGCILYNLVYGKTPFSHITNPFCKLQAIVNYNHDIDFPDISDKDLLDVLKKCLIRDPKQRPSIQELLQHPYLQKE